MSLLEQANGTQQVGARRQTGSMQMNGVRQGPLKNSEAQLSATLWVRDHSVVLAVGAVRQTRDPGAPCSFLLYPNSVRSFDTPSLKLASPLLLQRA